MPDGPDMDVFLELGRELLLVLAENGVLSVELVLSVLSRPPGVEAFLGTPDPKPGLRPF